MFPTQHPATSPAATRRPRFTNLLFAAAGVAAAFVAPDGAHAVPFSNSSSGGTALIAASGGDYATLAAAGTAFTAVAGGINGDWNILVANGAYTEPASAAFGNTVAAGKTVTLRPAPGATVSINFSATVANAGIDGGLIIGGTNLTSVDSHTATNNFIVDGCNTPGGTARNLTLSNTAAGFGQSVIRVHGASSNGVIRNCVITNNGTGGTNSYGILFTSRLTVTNFIPNNWTVRNNVINSTGGSGSAAQGIGCSNSGTITSGNAQTGHLFTGNTISARARGIFLNQNAGCTISNNTIRVNQDVAGSYSQGIYHLTANSASGWTINITGNRLDQLQTSATAANNGIAAMDFSAAGGGSYNVSSNMICGFGISQATATDLICRGIFVGSTVSPNLNVSNNSINIPAFAGVSGFTVERAGAVIVSNLSYSGTFTSRNNIIRVATFGATNASSAFCKLGSTGTFTANNDVIFTSGTVARSGYVNTTGYGTLASFQAAGFEAVGQSLDPFATYGSAWNGALDLRFSTALGLRPIGLRPAVPVAGVTSDIDGEARHASYPFPGCDEVTNSGAFAWFALDNASYSAYNSAWANGSNGGFGWGAAWAQFNAGANSGTFSGASNSTANGAATDTNNDGDVNTSNSSATALDRRAWGAFANTGAQIDMIRAFPRDMTTSDVVRAQFDNGTVQAGPPAGGVGISIRNASGNNVFEVYFQGGQTNYYFNDSLGNTINSGIPYSDEGIDVQFRLTGAGTYTCTIVRLVNGASVTRSGSLIAAAGGTVPRDIRFWNYTAGSSAAPNAYFNNLSLGDNTPPSATLSGPASSSSGSISYTVNFNEAITTLTGSMFTVVNGTAGTVSGIGTGPYTVPVTATGQGPVTINLPGGSAVDSGGAGNAASNTVSTVFDSVAPTVLGIAPVGVTTTNSTTLLYNVAFSEPVSGVVAGAFSLTYGTGVSGGVVGTPYSTKGGLTWVVPVTGVASTQAAGGTARLDLSSVTGITDGVNALAGTYNSGTPVTVDLLAPVVSSIAPIGAAVQYTATTSFLVTFSEPVTSVTASAFTLSYGTGVSGGTVGTPTTANGGLTWTVPITTLASTQAAGGTVKCNLSTVTGIADQVGFATSTFSSGTTVIIDRVAPTVSSIAPVGGPKFYTSSVSYLVTFTEPVSGVVASSFGFTYGTGVAGGTAGTPTTANSGLTWTVPVTGFTSSQAAGGTARLNLSTVTGITDGGNALVVTFLTGTVATIDLVAPSVSSIAQVGGSLYNINGNPNFLVTFSEAVTGVTSSSFGFTYGTGVSGGTIGTPTTANAGLSWTVPVTGVASTQQAGGTLRLNLADVTGISDGGFAPAVFNAGTAVTVDLIAPSVASITRNGAAQNTNASAPTFLVTFNEPMTGVVAGSFVTSGTATGATIGSLTGTVGTAVRTQAVSIPSTAAGVGTVGLRMTLVSGSTDMAGNATAGLPFNNPAEFYNTDRQQPLCTSVTRAFPPAGQDTSNTITWQYNFSEPITGFSPLSNGYFTTESGSFGVSGFVLNPASSSAQASTWQITFTGVTGDGRSGAACRYQSTAVDLFNNVLSINFTNAATWTIATTQTIDNTAPTVALTSTAPANTNVSPIPVTATFSEGVLNFDASDVVASGATVSGFTTVTSGVYTFNLVPTSDGAVTCNVAAAAASDKAYNFSTAATQLSRTYDGTAPSVAIFGPSDTITRTGSVDYTVVYTDATTITLSPANVVLNLTGTVAAGTTVTVSGSGDTTRTVSITNLSGDGTAGMSILAGTAFDAAGNLAPAAGPTTTFTVDNTPPTVALGAPSTTLTNTGPVDFPVNYTGATSVTLAAGDVTVAKTGTADYTGLTILGSGTAARTIRLSGITGDGTLAVSVAGSTAFDTASNVAAAAGPSATVTVDNTAPTMVIGSPSPSVTSAGPVDFTVTYTGASAVTLSTGDIMLNATGTAAGTVSVIGSGTATRTVRVSGITGDGSLGITIAAATASDAVGNTAAAAGPSDTFGVGNTAPSVDIAPPTPSVTQTSNLSFVVTYGNFTAITLVPANVTVVATGGAAGAVGTVTGSGATRTVTVTGVSGNGTLGISLAVNTATNSGQPAPTAVSPTAVIDNTAPTVTVSSPDRSPVTTGPVSFDVFFNEPVTGFAPGGVTVNRTGTVAGGTVSVSGSGTSYTVFLTALSGDGTVGVTVNAAAATDAAGNGSTASAASAASTVDNTAPTPTVGSPSPAVAASGSVSFPVTFNEPVTGFSLESDLQTTATGTAGFASAAVTGSGTSFTVTLNGVTGDGTIVVGVKSGVAVDAAGNANAASAASVVLTLDNTAPAVAIGTPSASLTRGGPVTFTVTYSDNVGLGAITLVPAGVTLNSTGNATGTVAVTGSGNSRTVTISSVTGDGTLGISIASGTATDTAGNAAADAGPSATFTVDNTAPTISIGAASEAVTNGGPVSYTVTYTGANAITLAAGDVTLNTTGNATGTVAVTGSGNVRTVTISSITGDGTLGISLAAGTASDTAGNTAAAAGPSATFVVDNTAPTVATGAPSVSATKNGPVTYTVTYSGADAITLGAGNVNLNTTGNATGTVAVTGSGNTRTVTISSITGDGTLGISLAAGTAADTAGNLALAAGPSATFTVDNSAPTVAIGAPSVSATKLGPVTYTVTYTGSTAVTLATGDVTLNTTGNANGTVAVTGSGATRTVTISSITGDGTLGISLAAATAFDAVGNLAAAAGPSATFSVDNTVPSSSASAPADWTLVGTTVSLGFTASDSGVGLASTELYVKAPGSGSFVATGLTLTGGAGSFTYTFGAGGGYYQFATRATDTVGNVQTAPASGTATVVVNPTTNAALSIPVATGTSVTVVYPMTSDLDVTLTFANVTVGGTASVSRSQPRAATPAYFQVPASLLNESLTVTGGGGLVFGTASLAWQYDPANAPAQPIGTAWKFNGGANPTGTYPVTPAANTLTLTGITGFSDFFAGSVTAVPVTVSGFEAE